MEIWQFWKCKLPSKSIIENTESAELAAVGGCFGLCPGLILISVATKFQDQGYLIYLDSRVSLSRKRGRERPWEQGSVYLHSA